MSITNKGGDKEAMLRSPQMAIQVAGVCIKSAGEVFAVAPNHPQSIRIKKATLAHEVAL